MHIPTLLSRILLLALLPTTTFAYFSTDLSLGVTHPEVVSLQSLLNQEGYAVTGEGEETTYFGNRTKDALTEFQIAHAYDILEGPGLLTDLGTLNPLTRAYLNSRSSHGEVLGATTDTFTVNLRVGMKHAQVQTLQQFLNQQGFLIASSGPGSKGKETTYFGPATALALKKYQEKYRSAILTPNGLTKGTGLFYFATRTHMNALRSGKGAVGKAPSTGTSSPTSVTLFTTNLSRGSSGASVQRLQEYLTRAGHLSVAPSAFFGPATEAAVKVYQRAHNIEATGIVGPSTRQLLNEALGSNTTDTAPSANALSPERRYVHTGNLVKISAPVGVAPFTFSSLSGEIYPIPGDTSAVFFRPSTQEGSAIVSAELLSLP
jgi:peptidoglycan hydrolase-like protein with peptidoglycan-binding domain